MATARHAHDLRRWADLTVIHSAFQARMPDVTPANSWLKEVAELCKRDYGARPAWDRNAVREQMLTIGADWDLLRDRLDQQSDECLQGLADFLR